MTQYEYLKQRVTNIVRVIDALPDEADPASNAMREIMQFELQVGNDQLAALRKQSESDMLQMLNSLVANPELLTPELRDFMAEVLNR
jgi:hypothetical protein